MPFAIQRAFRHVAGLRFEGFLDGAEIGTRSIIGAGALVTQNKKIPPGSLVLGSPARVVRQLDLEEQHSIKHWAEKYVELSKKYLAR